MTRYSPPTKKNKAWIFFVRHLFWFVCLPTPVRYLTRFVALPSPVRKKFLPHRSRKSRLQSLSPPREISLHRAVVPLAVRIGHRIGASGRPRPGAADDVAEVEKVAGDRRFLRRSPGRGAARPDPVGARSETA